MEKSEPLSPDKIRSGQELIKSKIFELAKKLELSNDDLEPLPDGVADIEGYCKSSPRIMWILKQPYDDRRKVNHLVVAGRFMVLSIMMMLSRIQLGNPLSIVCLAYVIINYMVIVMCHISMMISLWLIY